MKMVQTLLGGSVAAKPSLKTPARQPVVLPRSDLQKVAGGLPVGSWSPASVTAASLPVGSW